jgi:hypothetical protein
MSFHEFWLNVRTAAGIPAPQAVIDSPPLDVELLRARLAADPSWLTLDTVAGFDGTGLGLMPPDQKRALNRSVRAFRSVAHQVTASKPATKVQIDKALRAFLQILDILRPDRYVDFEAFVIGNSIQADLDALPPWVRDYRFETGTDVGDEPAVWIWVIADDDAINPSSYFDESEAVRRLLNAALRRCGFRRWAYIRFRLESEQHALAKGRRR